MKFNRRVGRKEDAGPGTLTKEDILAVIKTLIDNQEYMAIEKKNSTNKPLIEMHWILILLSLSLVSEWFIRKYKGLL